MNGCGLYHNVFLDRYNSVWAWGYNEFGQLGLGHKDDRYKPEIIPKLKHEKIIKLGAGDCHSLFLTEDGTLMGCGSNEFGQLNLNQTHVTIPTEMPGFKRNVKTFFCGGHCTLVVKKNNERIFLGFKKYNIDSMKAKIVDVNISNRDIFLLTSDGVLFGCGKNKFGELGQGNSNSYDSPVEILDNVKTFDYKGGHLLIFTNDERVFVCGTNAFHELGFNKDTSQCVSTPQEIFSLKGLGIIAVACGQRCSYFLTKNRGILGCGSNLNNQLGEGFGEDVPVPTEIKYFSGMQVVQVNPGRYHTLVLTKEKVFSLGLNGNGQRGLGNCDKTPSPKFIYGLKPPLVGYTEEEEEKFSFIIGYNPLMISDSTLSSAWKHF